ncbi:MAG: secretin and TonB N-terminal domain-containing protein [Kiritimatiellae bacterium]|nr:secretin and TonB N-terminal domain-containing protein [Kiritimatiellia bacterium]MDD4735822.1 secretin and TonB N-terminal domain-containing protein [Kiritimatiellia bacterium]
MNKRIRYMQIGWTLCALLWVPALTLAQSEAEPLPAPSGMEQDAALEESDAALLYEENVTEEAMPDVSPETQSLIIEETVVLVAEPVYDPDFQEIEQVASSDPEPFADELDVAGPGAEMELLYTSPFPVNADTNNLISLSLESVPVGDVVSMFARTIEEANIVTGTNDLRGVVTVNVKNVPWEDALSVILDSVGLAKVRNKGNIYTIVSKDQLELAPLESVVHSLDYMSAEEVLPVAKQMCISEGSGAFSAPGNTLVIKETVDRISKIRTALSDIDQPRDQVFIEAKFVELNAEAREDIGVDWSVLEGYKVGLEKMQWSMTDTRKDLRSRSDTMNQYDIWGNQDAVRNLYDANGNDLSMKGDTYNIVPGAAGEEVQQVSQDPLVNREYNDTRGRGRSVRSAVENTYTKTLDDVRSAILSPADFSLVLSALRQNAGVKVISNPKIIVLNEETANIDIGTREPNISTELITAENQPTRYISSLNEEEPYFQFGISLNVTPTVNTMSNISVRIEPTLTRFIQNKTAPDGNTFPVRSTKTIKTMFNLSSGKTVAIGGLTEMDNRDDEKKVPILGSIPVLGRLFSHTSKTHKQNETIIFVTVALAEPERITAKQGLPESTTLTKKYMIEQTTEKKVFDKELEVLELQEQIRLKKEMENYRKYLEKLQKKKDR